MMIRPAAFGYNPQTAASNRLQVAEGHDDADAGRIAIQEFDAAVTALRGAGVHVCVVEDEPHPPRPDAVFPNNWVSWHADGTVVLYPMEAPNRRLERRQVILEEVAASCGYDIRRVLDLSAYEDQGKYLEGTGSLVLDHIARRAYACRSSRTDESLVRHWAALLGYEPIVFDAADAAGAPFYHTNVMLSIGRRAVVVAAETLAAADRQRVLTALAQGGRELIEIDQAQVKGFAGNLLELAGTDGKTVFALSASAARVLPSPLRDRLAAATDRLLPIAIPTIERLGGGSVRCMLAEVFTSQIMG